MIMNDNYSSINPAIPPSINTFILSNIHLYIHLFNHPSIYSTIDPPIQLFNHPSIH